MDLIYLKLLQVRNVYRDPPSKWFCTVRRDPMRKWLKCLVTRKYLPFAKCDECTEFRAEMEATKDKTEKAKLS